MRVGGLIDWDLAWPHGLTVVGSYAYVVGFNKVVALRHYWAPAADADAALREYIGFEFSHDVVDDVLAACKLLESTWPIAPYPQPLDNATRRTLSVRAYGLLSAVDARLTPRAKLAWRWRVLLLRATIDHELATNGGVMAGTVLCRAFDELRTLYHVDNTTAPAVTPPRVPCH